MLQEQKGHQFQALGRSCGGFTTKIHVVSDALGLPLKLSLTGGHVHDSVPAIELLKGVTSAYVLADRGYDSKEIVEFIEAQGGKSVIPSRKNNKIHRSYDRHIYKERHLIECLFNKIKHYRRVATRYEKLADNFRSMVLLAFIMIWTRF